MRGWVTETKVLLSRGGLLTYETDRQATLRYEEKRRRDTMETRRRRRTGRRGKPNEKRTKLMTTMKDEEEEEEGLPDLVVRERLHKPWLLQGVACLYFLSEEIDSPS